MAINVGTGKRIDRQLKALADPARRRIVELLKRKGCCSCEDINGALSGLCVCDLESGLGVSQPTVTHHVRVLREAGLVKTQKIGRWLYCCRNEEELDRLGEWLQKM